MNKNIDLTKLLKQCPKGTKLYSRCLGSVEFCKITLDNYIEVIGKNGCYIWFNPNGTYQHSEESAEIDLFPSKDQRDWSKWHRPFVDGDVVIYDDDQFAIFEKYIKYPEDDGLIRYYVYYDEKNDDLDTFGGQAYVQRLATKKEKQKLFDVLKKEGYEWDAEKKELKPLQLFKDNEDKGNLSDGYHTFNELYEYRLLYNASMFNELAKQGLYDVHKSKKHSDGTIPFGDENWFIVQAELPTGQISNHYEMKDWDLFKIPEKEKANPYDGHTPQDVAKRLRNFLTLEKTIVPKFKVGDTIRSKNGLQAYKITGVTSEYYSAKIQGNDYVGVLPVKDQDDWMLVPNKSLTEYKIYYNRYTTDEDHHVGFTTLEAMEEALKGMRETNKGFPTYFNIVCKKETVERLNL